MEKLRRNLIQYRIDRGLVLKQKSGRRTHQNQYGSLPGIEPGATFSSRKACVEAGVHCVNFAGIHGSKTTGAYSICLSDGYEDDQDDGEVFVYTGTGGKEDSFHGLNKQVKNQSFLHNDNASLRMSGILKRPVRVVRGPNPKSKWAPSEGYRYDGLYIVTKVYLERGVSGYLMCKFVLQRRPGQPQIPVNPTFSILES